VLPLSSIHSFRWFAGFNLIIGLSAPKVKWERNGFNCKSANPSFGNPHRTADRNAGNTNEVPRDGRAWFHYEARTMLDEKVVIQR
jgi:hypothetical protein